MAPVVELLFGSWGGMARAHLGGGKEGELTSTLTLCATQGKATSTYTRGQDDASPSLASLLPLDYYRRASYEAAHFRCFPSW